jgi:hypothetical protein
MGGGVTLDEVTLVEAKSARASVRAVNKSRFTLFKPVPESLMREMNTDRPDTTESPYTIDAGHLQFELSLVEYAYSDDRGTRTDSLGVLPTNLKVGLLNNLDIQFVFTPYVREKTEEDGNEELVKGFGDDTRVRLKINLWGNDGPELGYGDTGFAIMPFVKFPTGSGNLSNDHIEGGVIFPLAIALPREFGLGLMAEVDFVYNEAEDNYGLDFLHTATIGHNIAGNLAGYVEYVGLAPNDTGGTYQAVGSAGLTYALSDNWILDFGGTGSPSDTGNDFTVFAGTSFRL